MLDTLLFRCPDSYRASGSCTAFINGLRLVTLLLWTLLACTRSGMAQTVQSLNLAPAGVTGGSGSTGTVTLSAVAAANVTVSLVNNAPSATLHAAPAEDQQTRLQHLRVR